MTTQPLAINAPDSHSEFPVVTIKMGHPTYSKEQVGWTVKIYTHSTSVWTELVDPNGEMRGGTCIDLYNLGAKTEEEEYEDCATSNPRAGLPMFIIDDADHGDCILFVTLDPEKPDIPLIELNDYRYIATPMLT